MKFVLFFLMFIPLWNLTKAQDWKLIDSILIDGELVEQTLQHT